MRSSQPFHRKLVNISNQINQNWISNVSINKLSVALNVNGRILGGVNARFGEFPHMCSVNRVRPVLPDQHVGGGNILNNRWILTAASVVPPPALFNSYEVICGRSNLGLSFEPTEQRVRVQTIYRHPQFLGPISANDIALVSDFMSYKNESFTKMLDLSIFRFIWGHS